MKTHGQITYWIDGAIPVVAIYHIDPGDRSVGWPEHVVVDALNYPGNVSSSGPISELVNSYADEIRAACMKDAKEE